MKINCIDLLVSGLGRLLKNNLFSKSNNNLSINITNAMKVKYLVIHFL